MPDISDYGDDVNRGSNGGGRGWKWDPESKTKVMPPKWSAFLDWLLSDPKHPATIQELAQELELHPDSLRRIKADKRFVEEWNKRAAEKNISPDRVQSVVDSLHAAAVAGDVKAASLYLQYIDRFTPKHVIVSEDKTVKDMTDDELAEALAGEAAHLRAV